MQTTHIIGLSGGKDSTATLLLALDRLPRRVILPVFVDTGNEHEQTYRYLDYLEVRLNIQIVRLKPDFSREIAEKRRFIARDQRVGRDKHGVKLRWSNRRKREALEVLHPTGNPFLDLCLLKGMFPSNRARFCTEKLKRDAFVSYVDNLVQAGKQVIVWQGIRRDESEKRKHARRFERVGLGFYYFRPLVECTEDQVFALLAGKGVESNPLYASGLGRVSCAPCIYSAKPDLRVLLSGPEGEERVARLREWERLVSKASKTGQAAFFHGKPLAGTAAGKVHPLVFWRRHSIDGIRDWALHHRDYFRAKDWVDLESEESGCSSELGLCS